MQPWSESASIGLLAGVLAGALLFGWAAERQEGFRPEDAGLGMNTRSFTARFEGLPVSAIGAPDGVFETLLRWQNEGDRTALWLGASQLHAINAAREGDRLAVAHANEAAAERSPPTPLRYAQVSAPNANLHDLLGAYLYLRDRGVRVDWLIVAVTYDDLREPGVKEEILDALDRVDEADLRTGGPGVAELREALSKTRKGEGSERHSPVERHATAGTPQEALERALTSFLDRVWPPYRSRTALRARIEVMARSLAARILGGVLKRRAAPIPADRRAWNVHALDSLFALGRAHGVKLLLYQPPHRPGEVPFYHDRQRYDAFFAELKRRCAAEGAYFADLETLVPAEYWGRTNEGRPDVFHFQGEGHRRLGAAINDLVARFGTEKAHALQ